MRIKSIYFFILIALVSSCSNHSSDVNSVNQVVNIDHEKFSNLTEANSGVILDVRTKEETLNGHLLNASFIDFYDADFAEKASWIKKGQPVYVYCHAGGRSTKAAEILIGLGFKEVYNLVGGYSNWNNSGYPIKKGLELNVRDLDVYTIEQINNVLKTNANTLLVFKTPWCLPCKKLDPVLDEFTQEYKNWSVVVINMDANSLLAKHYSVKSVPTLLGYRKTNNVFKHLGFITYADLVDAIH